MKLRWRLTPQRSHAANGARIIAAVENKDVLAPEQRLVADRDWVASLWRLKNRIDNSPGLFWILAAIAMIVLCILAMISKVWHPQPEFTSW
jgi:hypothetical protein